MSDIRKDLHKHFKKIADLHLRDLFKENPARFQHFSLKAADLFLDYSKNRITTDTLHQLVRLPENEKVEDKIQAMFAGKPINTTENRPVLHIALRNRSNHPIMVNGIDIMPTVNATLDKIRAFTKKVRDGNWRGFTDKPITDIVNIGIGGSDLGPKMVCHALSTYGSGKLQIHFISNIDGTAVVETLKYLNPETTLFIVASKTFTTIETLTNAETAKAWLLNKLQDQKAIEKHFVALSTNTEKVKAFGINPDNMFEFWDWVGGRYSVWSSIGLSVALFIGMDHFEEFLSGAHEMDEHFRTAPLTQNMPVILALIGVWYRNFFQCSTYTVLPYDQYLQFLPAYLQQLDMESNGKSVQLNGTPVTENTGPLLWGGIGTDGQHAFHQLLHQGTTITPVDFIIPRKSLNPVGKHHDLLFANCLAQSQAFMQGKTEAEIYDELIQAGLNKDRAKKLAPHKVMPGNRPSNTLMIDKLTPKTLGALIALYEHKVFVQGAIWNINSFDQWGVELGKQLANKITPDLTTSNKLEYDASTNGLIER